VNGSIGFLTLRGFLATLTGFRGIAPSRTALFSIARRHARMLWTEAGPLPARPMSATSDSTRPGVTSASRRCPRVGTIHVRRLLAYCSRVAGLPPWSRCHRSASWATVAVGASGPTAAFFAQHPVFVGSVTSRYFGRPDG